MIFYLLLCNQMKIGIKNIFTIPKSVTRNEELVVMPREQYEQIITNLVPSFYLKGKAARLLDNRVKRGLKEHKEKRTIKSGSLIEALNILKK